MQKWLIRAAAHTAPVGHRSGALHPWPSAV